MFFNSNYPSVDPSALNNIPFFVKSDYGFVHMYALTMVLGILFSILGSYVLAKSKKLPADPFIFSIIIIVPAALFFASFFGKTDFSQSNWFHFYNFAFWAKTGGMSIHGGVLGGMIAGLIFLKITTKKYNISMWLYADCILPNVLIGQCIGRWGNFFNHELLGTKTSYDALSWLPDFIRNNAFLRYSPTGFAEGGNGPFNLQFRQPIAVYESMLDLFAWIIIILIVPNLNRIFNHKIKHDYSNYQQFTLKKYFVFQLAKVKYFFANKKDIKNIKPIRNWTTFKQLYNNYYYQKKIWVYPKEEFKKKYFTLKLQTTSNQNRFKKFFINLKVNISYSRYLTKENNPKNYFILKCGVTSGLYLMFWNYIRFVLETQREKQELFIIGYRAIDYGVIIAIGTIGLLLAIYNQFINPLFFRKKEKLYEKKY